MSVKTVTGYLMLALSAAFPAATCIAQDEEPELLVLTNFVPPYAMTNDRGRAAGMDVDLVREWLDASGVTYQISMTNWSAAYSRTLESDNVLLFPLDRVAEREDSFTWLNRLRAQQYYVYSRREEAFDGLTRDQLMGGQWKVACTRFSIQCKFLERMGLPADRIQDEPGLAIPLRMRMLAQSRIDLTIFDEAVFGYMDGQRSEYTPQLARRFHVGETYSWIAGSKTLDPAISKRLNETPWPGSSAAPEGESGQ